MIPAVGAIMNKSDECRFTLWAPRQEKVSLHIVSPEDRRVPMNKDDMGYFTADLIGIRPGCLYFYTTDDGEDHPDPASFFQPHGVHGPSQVFGHEYQWGDTGWHNIPLKDFIIYEIHIGTFTQEGTFDAAISRLDDLADMGINAIEIMPISQFPGTRNWGYDGVFPYAPQNSYGGPEALKRLVDACHQRGIAVILDVVYNHLGPEGNCLPVYAPYFTDKYNTPWGQAVNFDDAWSDGVRNYFCNNALYWLEYFRIDALRLDAIHQMYDFGAFHFWEMLSDRVTAFCAQSGRHCYIIAESDLNNPKIIKNVEAGGYGFNAQWLDDFHHALHTLIDEHAIERYKDFGAIEQLAKAYTDGFVFSGEYVQARKKKYGRPSAGLPGDRFIIFNQNHDQVGNTADGGRLSTHVNERSLMIAAAAMMFAPYIPMLFMGEEYGEKAPFNYFIDHSDTELVEAVRKGRKKEFEHERWNIEPADPKSEDTFLSCKLKWNNRNEAGSLLLKWHKQLINLRRTKGPLNNFDKNDIRVYIIDGRCYALHRKSEDHAEELLGIFNLGNSTVPYAPPVFAEGFLKLLDSESFGTAGIGSSNLPNILEGPSINIPALCVAIYMNG